MASCLPWSRFMAMELSYCGKGPWVAMTNPITIFWLIWFSVFNGIWSLDLQPRAPKNLLLFVVGGCCRVCTLPRWNTCVQLFSAASCHALIRQCFHWLNRDGKCFRDPGRLVTMRRAHKSVGECSDKLNYPGARNTPGQDIRTADSSVSYDFDMIGLRWVVSHRRWSNEKGISADTMKGIENHWDLERFFKGLSLYLVGAVTCNHT